MWALLAAGLVVRRALHDPTTASLSPRHTCHGVAIAAYGSLGYVPVAGVVGRWRAAARHRPNGSHHTCCPLRSGTQGWLQMTHLGWMVHSGGVSLPDFSSASASAAVSWTMPLAWWLGAYTA